MKEVPFGAPADRAERLRARRDVTRRAVWAILRSDADFVHCVELGRAMDILTKEDWLQAASDSGFGAAQLGAQAKAQPPSSRQVVSAEVEDVTEHIKQALRATHPAAAVGAWYDTTSEYEARREAELEAAARFSATAARGYAAQAETRVQIVERVAAVLRPLSARLREKFAPRHILACPCSHAHCAFMAWIVESLGLPDEDLPVRVLLGSPVAGDLPPTRAWDTRYQPRSLGIDFHDLPHAQWNKWLAEDVARRAATADGAAEAAKVWAKTVAELDKGMSSGPYTDADMDAMYGVGGWRSGRRFAIDQNGSVRVIDDMKENLTNAGSNNSDRLRCQRPDFPAKAAAKLARHVPLRDLEVTHGTDDQEAAYRRVLTEEPGMCAVAVWHPHLRRTVFFVQPGFPFGLLSAVMYYNAVPAALTAAARRFTGSICDHYFDDIDTAGLAHSQRAAQQCVRRIFAAAGMPLSDEKHVDGAAANVFLGVESDLQHVPTTGYVLMTLTQERRGTIAELCRMGQKSLVPELAARLCGKLWWATAWTAGSVGRAAIQPINRRAHPGAYDVRDVAEQRAVERAMRFCAEVLACAPPRRVQVAGERRPSVIVWSDAMYEAKSAAPAAGGFVVYVPPEWVDGKYYGARLYAASHVTPQDFMRRMVHGKKTYIGQLEIAYAGAPYLSLPHVFRDRATLHWVDNTSAVAALVKGYAKPLDSGQIVNAIAAFNAGLRVSVYWEYIRSKANIADFPSRLRLDLMHAALRRAGIDVRVEMVECVLPSFDEWTATLPGEWLKRGRDTSRDTRKRRRFTAAH
jgi:hypothetical protein